MPYLIDAGTADETVTAQATVKRITCVGGGSGGTIIITPKGLTARPTITVPAGAPFEEIFTTLPDDQDSLCELPKGSTIAFAGMSAWFVRYSS